MTKLVTKPRLGLVDPANLESAINSKWDERRKKLKRFDIALPDLMAATDPNSPHIEHIKSKLAGFEIDRGGLSAHSLKMLASVLNVWVRYCGKMSFYSFPAPGPDKFVVFFKYLILSERSVATVEQYRSQLSYIYRLIALENPLRDEQVRSLIKSLKKDEADITGEAYTQEQAYPFRQHHLNNLMQVIDNDGFTSKNPWQLKKDIAVAIVAYTTGLREEEIGSIRVKHVTRRVENGQLFVSIKRVRSKSTTNVKPKVVIGTNAERFMAYVDDFSGRLPSPESYIFSHSSRLGKPLNPDTPMSGVTVDSTFARLYSLHNEHYPMIENDVKSWTGHSARIGRVQDGFAIHKMTIPELMSLGDWTSPMMVMRYLRGFHADDEANIRLQTLD